MHRNWEERVLPFEQKEVLVLKKECGCKKCDCELSQNTYHTGCHTFNLFNQGGDQTNSTKSGGLYDESVGPPGKKRKKIGSGFQLFTPDESKEEVDILELLESM